MVGVENCPGFVQVETVFGAILPRQVEDGVQPRTDPRMLGRLLAHAFQPVNVTEDNCTHLLGKIPVGNAGPIVRTHVALLAQLFADGVQLLAQQVLALGLVNVFCGLVAHLAAKLQGSEHLAHPVEQQPQSLTDVESLKQRHLLSQAEIG